MNNISLIPFPVLKTQRLVLRQLKESDYDELFVLRCDTIVNKFIKRKTPKNIDELKDFTNRINEGLLNNKLIYWVISLNNNSNLIGTICLWNFNTTNTQAEIGFELNSKFHGKGIMSEAIESILKFGFKKLKFKSISAYTHKENLASTTLLKKYGFKENVGQIDKDNLNNIIFIKTKDT